MILIILKSYFTILLSVGIGSVIIFLLGLYFIFRTPASEKSKNNKKDNIIPTTIPSETVQEKSIANNSNNLRDLSAIAGDDVVTTQLDLARAYIETGRMQLAKSILEFVLEQGNTAQQEEAQQLMNHI